MLKNKILYILSSVFIATAFLACSKEGNYPGGQISPYIGIFDVRTLYKGSPVTLNEQNLGGSSKITGIVVSDHEQGNFPDGYLVLQDKWRLNQLRGITIPLGEAAKNYSSGDSITVDILNGQLVREEGILQIKNISEAKIQKISANNTIPVNRVNAKQILSNPNRYESTLVNIVKGGFNPIPASTDVLAGEKVLNDGFGNIALVTKSSAKFGQLKPSTLANYNVVIFNKQITADSLQPYQVLRKQSDITELSAVTSVATAVISGFASDVKGGDGNYEYIQLLATQDIDFSQTPYSVIVSNNANNSTPTGVPAKGWATGNMRTYKLNITKGKAVKGQYFYVGGRYQLINGSSSTSIAEANWVLNYDYVANNGFDGIGAKTGGLMANSGNAFGIAVFNTLTVTEATTPIDVMFISGGGALTDGNRGYRIVNNDYYDIVNPITLQNQPFYMSGSNNIFISYNPSDVGFFVCLGGVYNTSLNRWTQARSKINVEMTKESKLAEIENEQSTKLEK